MAPFKRIALLLGLLLGMISLQAQHLNFLTTSPNLTICGKADTFSVVLNNFTADTLQNPLIVVLLHGGVEYQNASLSGTGFLEFDVSNPDSVAFLSPTILPFQNVTFSFTARANCSAADSAAGNNKIFVFHPLGVDSTLSQAYNLISPSLSISSVSPGAHSGPVGSSFSRCVTLTNGGFGGLSHFQLAIQRDAGSLTYSNFTVGGTPLVPAFSGDSIILTLGPTHCQLVGDLDTLLEQGEALVVCYDILISDCINGASNLHASWGCGGNTCQTQSTSANVVVPVTVPNLTAVDIYAQSTCYDNMTPSVLKIVVTNTGSGPARNVILDVWHGGPSNQDNLMSRWDTSTIRWVDAGNNVQLISPFYTENGSTSGNLACLGPNPIRRFKVMIPLMQAGEKDTLIVDQLSCCKLWCNSDPVTTHRSYYEVTYQDQCLNSNYSIAPNMITTWNFGRILTLTPNGPSDISSGDTALFSLEHSYFRFYNHRPDAIWWAELILPPTLNHSGSTADFWYEDVDGDIWNPDSLVISGDTIRGYWDLPNPGWFSLEKSNLKFRVTPDCSGGPCSSGPYTITYRAFENPDPSCTCVHVLGCFSFNFNLHCGICPANCLDGGMIFAGFEAYRLNYGKPDNNDDGLADGSGTVDMNLVRTQYLMFTDTLFTRFHGIVDTTASNPFWVSGRATTRIPRGVNMTPISHTVRIVDTSAHAVYNCNLPAPTITPSGIARTYTYNFDVSALSACLPGGFVYESGDTVEITALYKVTQNTSGLVEAQPLLNDFYLIDTSNSNQASCDDYGGNFVMVGYYFTTSATDQVATSGCGNKTVTENYYLSIGNCCSNYAGGNLFNNEFRQWAHLGTCRVVLPPGYTYQSATINFRRTAGTQTTAVQSSGLTPVAIYGDTVEFDVGALFQVNGGPFIMGDDGWYGTLNVAIQPGCAVIPDVDQAVRYIWDFETIPALAAPGAYTTQRIGIDYIRYEAPEIVVNPLLQTAAGVDSSVSWEFSLENNSNSSGASNAWFALYSPSGQIIPTQVIDLGNNNPLAPVGGLYQLGLVGPGGSRSFRITANYTTCDIDTLYVLAGWDCASYPPNLLSLICPPVRDTFYLDPQPSQIQASLNLPAGPFDMCDSILVELHVVSSQIASVRDLLVGLRLPLSGGLTYVAGSATLEYPDTTGFASISDPALLGGFLVWDINNEVPLIAARDLPGTARSDSNSFRIRFYLQTNCNFISGETFIMRVRGRRICGDLLAPVVLISPQVNINGAAQPYTTNLITTSSPVSTCPLVRQFRIKMVNAGLGASSTTDSVFVDFPLGYTWNGNFVSLHNAPGVTNPSQQISLAGTRLGWEIPAGTAVGDSMVFSFQMLINDQAVCGNDLINVQTAVNANLFCSTSSSFCSGASGTGSALLSVPVAKPSLSFTSLASILIPTTGGWNYQYNGSLDNAGNPISGSDTTTVLFYCDSDGSNGYSAGDVLIGAHDTLAAIPNGGTLPFSGGFFIPGGSCTDSSMIYGLVVPDGANGYCLCDTAFGNSNVILPVTWLSVQGQVLPEGNRISWSALELPGHAYFEVERETEGLFAVISPRFSGKSTYHWLDGQPGATEKYRIRQTDQDGKSTWSKVVELTREAEAEVRIWPNPARDRIFLSGPPAARWVVYDGVGREVLGGRLDEAGRGERSLGQLAGGVYQVKLTWGGGETVERLVVE
ncbi:MAG: T9SS type A sorting domain-containing protein [Bacteroidia bacterium]|nr:T9SS type A sorting domain-containing protein [Bacteroidia bacterium]